MRLSIVCAIAWLSATSFGQGKVTMSVTLKYGYLGYFECQDMAVIHNGANWNLGGNSALGRNFPPDDNLFLRFDLSHLPKTAEVVGAELHLYVVGVGFNLPTMHEPGPIGLFEVAGPWVEGVGLASGPEPFPTGATFLTHDGVHPWKKPGGDYFPKLLSQVVTEGPAKKWYRWGVPTEVAQAWLTGSRPNNGVLLKTLPGFPGKGVAFAMKEHADAKLRPKLKLKLRLDATERTKLYRLRRAMSKMAKDRQAAVEAGRRQGAKQRVDRHKARLKRMKGMFSGIVKPNESFVVGTTQWQVGPCKRPGKRLEGCDREAKGVFVRIDVSARCYAKEPVMFAAPELVDTEGKRHPFRLAATGAVQKDAVVKINMPMQPRTEARFSLVYDVPESLAQMFLDVPDLQSSEVPHVAVDMGAVPRP